MDVRIRLENCIFHTFHCFHRAKWTPYSTRGLPNTRPHRISGGNSVNPKIRCHAVPATPCRETTFHRICSKFAVKSRLLLHLFVFHAGHLFQNAELRPPVIRGIDKHQLTQTLSRFPNPKSKHAQICRWYPFIRVGTGNREQMGAIMDLCSIGSGVPL